MEGALIVTLFTFLRLGVPLSIMLIIGEAVRRHNLRMRDLRST